MSFIICDAYVSTVIIIKVTEPILRALYVASDYLRPCLHEPGFAPNPGQLDLQSENFSAFTRTQGGFCRNFLTQPGSAC